MGDEVEAEGSSAASAEANEECFEDRLLKWFWAPFDRFPKLWDRCVAVVLITFVILIATHGAGGGRTGATFRFEQPGWFTATLMAPILIAALWFFVPIILAKLISILLWPWRACGRN